MKQAITVLFFFIIAVVSGEVSPCVSYAADINGDGDVTLLDMFQLINFVMEF